MENLILFVFATVGFTYINVDSSLMSFVRDYVKKKHKGKIDALAVAPGCDVKNRWQRFAEYLKTWSSLKSWKVWWELRKKGFWWFQNSIWMCHQCMGFWSGLFCGLCLEGFVIKSLLYGFAGSFLAPVFQSIMTLIEAKTFVAMQEPIPTGNDDESTK